MQSSTQRSIFNVTTYNPGPGQYETSSSTSQPVFYANDGYESSIAGPSFGRDERFPSDSVSFTRPNAIGPGTYNLKGEFSKFHAKQQLPFANPTGKIIRSTNLLKSQTTNVSVSRSYIDPNLMRINGAPSTGKPYGPNNNFGDSGFLLLQGDLNDHSSLIIPQNSYQLAQQFRSNHVAPNTYHPNIDVCKRKAPSISMTKAAGRMNPDPDSAEELTPEQQRVLDLRSFQMERQIEDQMREQKNTIPGVRFKSEITSLVSKDPKKSMIGEYNLELLMIRERQLASEKIPAPGSYHNEAYHTSFKPAMKPTEFQCFNSSVQRFEDNNKSFSVGPGQYSTQPSWMKVGGGGQQKKVGGAFSREIRSKSGIEKSSWQPGPGEYDSMKCQEIGFTEKYELHKLKQDNLAFNSVFGSGQARFPTTKANEESESNPGPGSYNISKKKQKKLKRMMRPATVSRIKSQNSKNEAGSETKDIPDSMHAFRNQSAQNPKRRNRAISNQMTGAANNPAAFSVDGQHFLKQGYQFSSQTDRFNKNYEGKSALSYSEGGPGAYEIGQDFSMQKMSHNKRLNLMNKSERVTDLIDISAATPIGPGFYEIDMNVVKPRHGCITRI